MPAGFLSASRNELDRTAGWRVHVTLLHPRKMAIELVVRKSGGARQMQGNQREMRYTQRQTRDKGNVARDKENVVGVLCQRVLYYTKPMYGG